MTETTAPAGFTAGRLESLAARGGAFGCVLADPPWRYDRRPRGAAEHHYRTMTLDEIAALPVARLAAREAHLHLWTTAAFLFDAQRVIDAWGFAYKGLFVWTKPRMGTGHYWRNAAEFLLLGVRGNLTFRDRTIPNWACLDRHAHSEKPERVRALVERVSPGPYLELFGRRAEHGWTVFGDQVSRGLFDADVVDLDDRDDADEAPPPPPGAASVTPAKARPPLSAPPEPEYVSVGDLARRLGVSRSNVYALVAAGHLPHIRVGVGRGTIRIPAQAAADYERRVERDDAASWSGHFA